MDDDEVLTATVELYLSADRTYKQLRLVQLMQKVYEINDKLEREAQKKKKRTITTQ